VTFVSRRTSDRALSGLCAVEELTSSSRGPAGDFCLAAAESRSFDDRKRWYGTRRGPSASTSVKVSEALHWFDFICPFCYVSQDRDEILIASGFDVAELPLLRILASAPTALETYLTVSGLNTRASLSVAERETVQITAGATHGCGFCVAGHTAVRRLSTRKQ
jgi:hypothetical protein